MLKFEVDNARVTASQRSYREEGTLEGQRFAAKTMSLRMAFEALAKSFEGRQVRAKERGQPYLENGRIETIRDLVLDGALAWPARSAAVLHGLHGPYVPLGTPDGESYLGFLNDGPPQARTQGDMTAIVIYCAPLNVVRVLWIGTEADAQKALSALNEETSGWTDWSSVYPNFAAELDRLNAQGKTP